MNLQSYFKMASVKSVLWPALVNNVVDVSLSGGSLGYWTACNNVKCYCTVPYCVPCLTLISTVWVLVCATAPPVRSPAKASAILNESVTAVTASRFSPVFFSNHCPHQKAMLSKSLKNVFVMWPLILFEWHLHITKPTMHDHMIVVTTILTFCLSCKIGNIGIFTW